MTDDVETRLAEIQARCDAATPGPWEKSGWFRVEHIASVAYCGPSTSSGRDGSESICDAQAERNTAFIAHHRAMNLAAQAVRAAGVGDQEKAQQLLVKAFRSEAMAANIVATIEDSEPTRSVLHRSAASLAANADMYHEAVRYAEAGLAGTEVPPGIQEELKHVLMLARGALVAEMQAQGDEESTESEG